MIERKLKKRRLEEKPAIIIAAFGSTGNVRWVYDLFQKQLEDTFAEYKLLWAYTSEIIREKTGQPGILQALSEVEQCGYKKAVIQPLHIVPGTEYQILYETCKNFPGIRVVMGETLMHRWHYVERVLQIISGDFLKEDEGLNILFTHGTQLTADPVNSLYIGLEQMLEHRYKNVYLCSIEGLPDRKAVLNKIKKNIKVSPSFPFNVRLIPLMFVPGKHVEEDLVGDENSFAVELQHIGFRVELLTEVIEGNARPKGLGCYREVREQFIENIKRSLELIRFY